MALVSMKIPEQTGPAENKRAAAVPQKRATGKDAKVYLAKKEKNKAISSDHQIIRRERVKVSESRALTRQREREGSDREHGEERVDSTV